MKKLTWVLGLGLLISVVLFAILIYLSPFLLSAYKDEIAGYLAKSLHRKVEIRKISLSLIRGPAVTIEEIEIENLPGFRNPSLLKIDSLHLSIRFWPLLRQEIVSDGLTVNRPRFYLETNARGVSNLDDLESEDRPAPRKESHDSAPELLPGIAISKLQIANGQISSENAMSHDLIHLAGINIVLPKVEYHPEQVKKSLLEGIILEGTIDIGRGQINQFQFERLQGGILLEKMGLSLKSWALSAYGGTLAGNLDLAVGQTPLRYRFNGKGKKLNLQTLLNENSSLKDLMEGSLSASLSLKGEGTELSEMEKSLSGEGNFILQNGTFKGSNLLGKISILSKLSFLEARNLVPETRFDSLKGDWLIASGKIVFPALRGAMPEGEISGRGTVTFHKEADFKFNVVLNKAATEKFPPDTKRFLADENGRAVFPVAVKGYLSSPEIRLEEGEMSKKAVREGIRGVLQPLLNRLHP